MSGTPTPDRSEACLIVYMVCSQYHATAASRTP
jgi:hypothetical protein